MGRDCCRREGCCGREDCCGREVVVGRRLLWGGCCGRRIVAREVLLGWGGNEKNDWGGIVVKLFDEMNE